MNETPLLDCPFCGAPAQTVMELVRRVGKLHEVDPVYFGECQNCGAQGPPAYDHLSAARTWNRRIVSRETKAPG